jgi:hypothetical protein
MLAAFSYSGVVLFNQYITAALRRAHYEILEDGSGFYGSIPGFEGIWPKLQRLRSFAMNYRAL